MKTTNKGFTLMELLIVIGVLGILAAGLLAAIDPFEQLKKTRDTNNRSAAIELLGASQRYFATHGYLPWYKTTAPGVYDTANCPALNWGSIRPATATITYPRATTEVALSIAAGDPVYDCLTNTLGVDGEIKATFFEGLKSPLYIMSGGPTSAAVCFAPESKSNLNDAQSQYVFVPGATVDLDAVSKPVAGCTAADKTAGNCLQCFE